MTKITEQPGKNRDLEKKSIQELTAGINAEDQSVAYVIEKELPTINTLIEKIVNTENETLLNQVKHLLEEEEVESWGNLDPALKASINRGLAQSDRGEGIPHKKVMSRLRKKYSK